jgi:hypothetical protein
LAAAVPGVIKRLAPWLDRQNGAEGAHDVPEIDGFAGIATLALVVGIGLLIFNRTIHR